MKIKSKKKVTLLNKRIVATYRLKKKYLQKKFYKKKMMVVKRMIFCTHRLMTNCQLLSQKCFLRDNNIHSKGHSSSSHLSLKGTLLRKSSSSSCHYLGLVWRRLRYQRISQSSWILSRSQGSKPSLSKSKRIKK